MASLRRALNALYNAATHAIGRLNGKYYFEDFVRVYPGGVAFSRLGRRREATDLDRRNFANHAKFYRFAAQFVRGRTVADVGCGSGYGCAILRDAGAAAVHGADVSKAALSFAREHFGGAAEFSEQSITDLALYRDAQLDVAITSEVLEHVKEYGKEQVAVSELLRVTKPGGVIVLATPNTELLPGHGFSFDEMDELLRRNFATYALFENALAPPDPVRRQEWDRRVATRRTGVVVSQAIDLSETVLLGGRLPEVKIGAPPGVHQLGGLAIDTSLLHNTHSWIAVAIR